jgi:hypothetical protein
LETVSQPEEKFCSGTNTWNNQSGQPQRGGMKLAGA